MFMVLEIAIVVANFGLESCVVTCIEASDFTTEKAI